jgi:AAA+ superfamily predicted ATPase
MAGLEEGDLAAVVGDFRTAMEDCEDLYLSGAQEHARSHPELTGEARRDFVQRMADLSHGLLVKIFLDVAYADRKWTEEDFVLAREMFDHVWGKRLKKKELREALTHFLGQSGLTWDVLLGPFERMGTFRRRAAQLQTVVMRLANIVAKADRTVLPEEVRQLQWIQAEMRRVLERVPLSEPDRKEPSGGPEAQQEAAFEIVAPPQGNARPREAVVTEPASPEQQLQEALAELDGLIGMDAIKQEVRGLINFLKVQKVREEFDLPQTQISLHSVFQGRPGTGKTTVARLLGRLLGAMGILRRGHLVETDRSGLVAEYAGQTGPKTNKKIDEALDGVLFIDEAYSLVAEKGDDPYGAEALQALLKRMEDDRDRLVVILAGYPQPMERLLRTNPGLSSRFSRQFSFPDHSAGELLAIFDSLCQSNRYVLPVPTRVKLLLGFQHLLDRRDERFGNGRLARNTFERAINRLANRIAAVLPLTRELLTTLQPDDVYLEGVPETAWANLDSEDRCFRTTCPGCGQTSRFPQKLLGHQVQCRRCQASFRVDWARLALDA